VLVEVFSEVQAYQLFDSVDMLVICDVYQLFAGVDMLVICDVYQLFDGIDMLVICDVYLPVIYQCRFCV
jgi:hypothetical protein